MIEIEETIYSLFVVVVVDPSNLCPFNESLNLLLGGLPTHWSEVESGTGEASVSRKLFGCTVILSVGNKKVKILIYFEGTINTGQFYELLR